MWPHQPKFKASHCALFFSIILHILIFIILLNSEFENKVNQIPEMKVSLVSLTMPTSKQPENEPSKMPEPKIKDIQNDSNQITNSSDPANEISNNNIHDPIDVKKNTENLYTKDLYDPLLDAQNRAKKAVIDAKKKSDLYNNSLEKFDGDLSKILENKNFRETQDNDISNNLYKIEIINNSTETLEHSHIIEQALLHTKIPEEIQKINHLKETVTLLFKSDILSKKSDSRTSITFIVVPKNLTILIKLDPSNIYSEEKIEQFIKQENLDLIFINSNLNDAPYSFSVEI
ncbi:hypothetical protein EXE30_13510 [Acinetobacter halotolerans]|uniref:Uncharacterized protein n=1 Tax=Acinetobacter halotolerans TaxID=1752076 RepID=A0A4Q6XEH1_9GAMM|nr:hypothetical protein [Acinetobacter halotolerans]RZF50221.1 hypothetical protein EXE30_13510 [Acinetobacter halotolerans]